MTRFFIQERSADVTAHGTLLGSLRNYIDCNGAYRCILSERTLERTFDVKHPRPQTPVCNIQFTPHLLENIPHRSASIRVPKRAAVLSGKPFVVLYIR